VTIEREYMLGHLTASQRLAAEAALTVFEPTAPQVAAAALTPDAPRPVVYLLWSNKHSAWWKAGAWGYTPDRAEAGRFSEHEAIRYVVRSAMCGIREQVTYMVAAPDNWQPDDREPIATVLGGETITVHPVPDNASGGAS
jgi:hypothetical protein